jgi:hypothetical protein
MDLLKKKFWTRLESFLFDTYSASENRDLRVLITYNTDNKRRRCRFKNFVYEERSKEDSVKSSSRNHSKSKEIKDQFMVQSVTLNPLEVEDAAELLLAKCERRLTKQDFFSKN